MSPRPDVSAERKPQILQAALQVFLHKGFEAARMSEIAAQAGLSVGNLYLYFAGKLDIVLALMNALLEPSAQGLETLLSAPGSCRQRLEQSFLYELEMQDASDLRLYNEMYHLAINEPRVRQVLSTYNLRYQGAIAALIQQGIHRSELRSTDPQAAAFAFQSVFDGLMQNLLLSPSNFDLSIVLHQVFDMLFDGLEIK